MIRCNCKTLTAYGIAPHSDEHTVGLWVMILRCRLRSLASYLSVSHNVRETGKTNEGVWKETTESAPTLQLSRVVIGKRHKKWHITAGSDNVRFISIQTRYGYQNIKKWTTPTPKADSRRRQMQVIRVTRNTGLCSEAHDGFIVISDMRSGQSLCCDVYAEY